MIDRTRVNRAILVCAIAITSAIGLGSLAGWIPAMLRSLRGGAIDGVVGGADFAMFWTAGRLASQGEWEALYSLSGFAEVMGAPLGAVSFAYPPPFAMALQPFSGLEPTTAAAIWLTASAGALLLAVLLDRWGLLGLLAMLFSAYVALRFGQLVPIAVGFAALSGRVLERGRPFAAGIALGLLSFKPQFLIGPVIVFAASPALRRSVLPGIAASAGTIAGLSLIVAPEAWSAYISGLRDIADPGVSTRWDFSVLSLTSSLPSAFAAPLTVGLIASAVFVALRSSGLTNDTRLKLAIGLTLSLLVTPRAVNYDWALLIPAIAWISPSIRLDSRLVPAAAVVTLASLSGFVGASWVAWTALAAFLVLYSTPSAHVTDRGVLH